MVRLSEDDSVKRVEDATERHMRLCTQNPNAEKYRDSIRLRLDDFKEKITNLNGAQKEVNSAQDTVWFFDMGLDNVLRDVNGRAKEFDRNHVGSNTATLLFPGGNITEIINLPDKEEPGVAHGIAQKVLSLGSAHELFPYSDKIENAVTDCRKALAQQVIAIQNMGEAKTALSISKIALVRQYNATYFVAAADVSKAFAEGLFPQLNNPKKKNGNSDNPVETAKV